MFVRSSLRVLALKRVITVTTTTPRLFPLTRRIMTNSFTPDSLNPAILNVQYAVRGELAIKAEEYRERLKEHPNDHGLPFDKVINANIGNPQQAGLDQKPLTFGRQVRPRVLWSS